MVKASYYPIKEKENDAPEFFSRKIGDCFVVG